MLRAAVLFLACLAGCHGTSANYWATRPMTPDAEALAGRRAAPALEARYGGIIRDAQVERRLECVGRRLRNGSSEVRGRYQYRLLDTDRINAFSLPGGLVYMTRGLYARLTTDELAAAVIAHEMAHITSKDHFKPRCSTDGEALDRELAADRIGISYLRAAGISPTAMADVIRIIQDVQPPGWATRRMDSVAQAIGSVDLIERFANVGP